MAVTARLYRDRKLAVEQLDPELISNALSEDGALVWLDIEDPTEADLQMLEREFSLHHVAMDAIRERDQRPRVDVLGDIFFLAVYAFRMQGGACQPQEIHALVTRRFLITLRYPPAFELKPVLRRWELEGERAARGGGFLLHALLDEVVDTYLDVVNEFDIASEEVESEIFSGASAGDVQRDIYERKKQLLEFRRRIIPLREVLDLLQEERAVVSEELTADFKDVADNVLRTIEMIDHVRDLLSSAVNAHLSIASHEMNQIMKKLTSWAAIILAPTLIAGIYGMNFRHMPELNWAFGYPFALGLMLLAAGTLYVLFKRRDWL
jgi:magnesium transporter